MTLSWIGASTVAQNRVPMLSGGHSTGLIDDIPSVADLVTRLGQEFAAARAPAHWRSALARAEQPA